MPNRTFSSPSYRYGFNSQEKDDETTVDGGSYDFGARIFDARVGRFYSIDNLTNKYPNLNPYQFSNNSPIAFTDIKGDSIYFVNSAGEVIKIGGGYSWVPNQGQVELDKCGFSILMKTQDGQALLEKYQNNSTHDVYITISEFPSDAFSDAPVAETFDESKTSKATDKSGIVNLNSPQVSEGTQKRLANFQNLQLKNPKSKASLIAINKTDVENLDVFDLAEVLYHEIVGHVDINLSTAKAEHGAIGVPEVRNGNSILMTAGSEVGVVSATLKNGGTIPKDYYITPGSKIAKIVQQLVKLKQEESKPSQTPTTITTYRGD